MIQNMLQGSQLMPFFKKFYRKFQLLGLPELARVFKNAYIFTKLKYLKNEISKVVEFYILIFLSPVDSIGYQKPSTYFTRHFFTFLTISRELFHRFLSLQLLLKALFPIKFDKLDKIPSKEQKVWSY